MRGSLAGRAFLIHRMDVVQDVAGMAEYFRLIGRQAKIILPVFAQVLMRGMRKEGYLRGIEASRSVQYPRLRADHEVRILRHYQTRSEFPPSRPRQIAI